MYRRFIDGRVKEALADTPVVLIVGPRRAGKTTLARSIGGKNRAYLTLDDQTTLDAARADPVSFVRGLGPSTIDEIQRAPDLLLAIKKVVDDDNRPGHFLLTGSANVLTLPKVADSLAGRMETIRMLPLAHSEIIGRPSAFLTNLFSGKSPKCRDVVVADALVELALAGGFPEAIDRVGERRRQDWARSYLESILTRDLRDIADVEKLTELPKFVRLLAEHAGQLVNYSEFGSGINVTHKTSQRYVGLLEKVFLVSTLQPWYANTIKRVIKTPKLQFLDTGILAASRGLTLDRLKRQRKLMGPLLENFVFTEIVKLMSWSEFRLTPYHFRNQEMDEVDIVVERDDGMVVGIEVKASATVATSDFSGMRKLTAACGEKFVFGVVLYDGDTVVPFGPKLIAAPISCLWG
jgi:predicted AAA+ superfamily ATPase